MKCYYQLVNFLIICFKVKEEHDLLPIEELQSLIGRGPNRLGISDFWAEIPESFARTVIIVVARLRNLCNQWVALFCRDHALFGFGTDLEKKSFWQTF